MARKKTTPISVESSESLDHGFVLNEAEIRRLNEECTEQLGKLEAKEITTVFQCKFANGVIANYQSIDDLLQEENSGSSRIISLTLTYTCGPDTKPRIVVSFSDVDASNVTKTRPISYDILGLNRDWVFVTSSMLSERIGKFRRNAWSFFGWRPTNRYISALLVPIGMLIPMFVSLYLKSAEQDHAIDMLETAWRSGKVTDMEAVFGLFRITRDRDTPTSMLITLAVIGLLAVALLGFSAYYDRLYPKYNFVWGDYRFKFEKIEQRRKTINIVFFAGLAVSIIGGLIGQAIWGIF